MFKHSCSESSDTGNKHIANTATHQIDNRTRQGSWIGDYNLFLQSKKYLKSVM